MITTNKLTISTSSADHLCTFTRLKLNIVNNCTNRHVFKWHCITWLNINFVASNYLITCCQTLWRDDVSFFAVSVRNQSDKCCTVWIILDGLNLSWDVFLIITSPR